MSRMQSIPLLTPWHAGRESALQDDTPLTMESDAKSNHIDAAAAHSDPSAADSNRSAGQHVEVGKPRTNYTAVDQIDREVNRAQILQAQILHQQSNTEPWMMGVRKNLWPCELGKRIVRNSVFITSAFIIFSLIVGPLIIFLAFHGRSSPVTHHVEDFVSTHGLTDVLTDDNSVLDNRTTDSGSSVDSFSPRGSARKLEQLAESDREKSDIAESATDESLDSLTSHLLRNVFQLSEEQIGNSIIRKTNSNSSESKPRLPLPPMGWMAWERFRCQTDCEKFPRGEE
jgi:hypothetical protein